jgi:DNA repair protein RadC
LLFTGGGSINAIMTHYHLKELMAMDNEALKKAARLAFSMQLDAFSELGQRTIKKRLAELDALEKPRRLSPAISKVIGMPAVIIENILDYQEAQSAES